VHQAGARRSRSAGNWSSWVTALPVARPESQEVCGVPRGSRTPNPNYVRVINSPWLGINVVKRKAAEYYVREGQAIFVGEDLLMIESDPKFRAALAQTIQKKMAQDLAVDVRGPIWWNGSDTRHGAVHQPGQSPVFARPDCGRVQTEYPGDTLTRMGMRLETAPGEKNTGGPALQYTPPTQLRTGNPRQTRKPKCERV
jgi:hypothetical protein